MSVELRNLYCYCYIQESGKLSCSQIVAMVPNIVVDLVAGCIVVEGAQVSMQEVLLGKRAGSAGLLPNFKPLE